MKCMFSANGSTHNARQSVYGRACQFTASWRRTSDQLCGIEWLLKGHSSGRRYKDELERFWRKQRGTNCPSSEWNWRHAWRVVFMNIFRHGVTFSPSIRLPLFTDTGPINALALLGVNTTRARMISRNFIAPIVHFKRHEASTDAKRFLHICCWTPWSLGAVLRAVSGSHHTCLSFDGFQDTIFLSTGRQWIKQQNKFNRD